jgi:hypothetical protein
MGTNRNRRAAEMDRLNTTSMLGQRRGGRGEVTEFGMETRLLGREHGFFLSAFTSASSGPPRFVPFQLALEAWKFGQGA